jgi:ParB family chromosome partitioning protein
VTGEVLGQGEKPRLLEQLDSQADVVIREIPLDAIEPDPDQPRLYFDDAQLHELAASIRDVGMLHLPAVYPIASDGVQPTRFRLLFGERRWRAARLAGWKEMHCKVAPSVKDGDLIARLKIIDQQEHENFARAALSAVEEARGLKNKLDVLWKLEPEAAKTELVEKLATERRLSPSAVFRLLDLLEAPESLRSAILERRIVSREVAFQLSAHWTALVKKHSTDATSRRELQFREAVATWVRAQGRELSSETYGAYAAAHFLDPKMVRGTIRAAEKVAGQAEEEFATVVQRAVREGWTVKDARRNLGGARGARTRERTGPRLFERTGSRTGHRLVINLGCLDDPQVATTEAREELATMLREVLAAVCACPPCEAAATP